MSQGKVGFWRLDPVYADTLVDGVFKKRRPSQRGSSSGNSTPLRKKSRKKDNLRNGCPQPSALNEVKNIVVNGTDSTLIHDTPPNSTESYTIYGEANDVVELVTAVNSIEGVGSVGQCSSYSYTMQGSQSESHLSHPGYGNEICITESAPDTCILETDGIHGGDICWNAILTDADLNELTNFTGPVIQTADSSITVSDSNTTTAQLTAVEPHSLHLVANVANIRPTNGVIQESELFHSGITRHINCLAIRPTLGSDVISATHNVVTCVNPTTVNTTDWNHWQTFSTVGTHENHSTDLIIRHINSNGEPIVSTSPPITYTTTTTAVNSRPVPALKQNVCVNSQQNSSSNNSTQPSSPTSANFEHNCNPLQPWAECKAALEAAALDLENFGTLDVVHHY